MGKARQKRRQRCGLSRRCVPAAALLLPAPLVASELHEVQPGSPHLGPTADPELTAGLETHIATGAGTFDITHREAR